MVVTATQDLLLRKNAAPERFLAHFLRLSFRRVDFAFWNAMRVYRIALFGILMLVAAASSVAHGVWADPVRTPALASASTVGHAVGSAAVLAATTPVAARTLPVRAEFDDMEVRTLASNDFPPAPSTRMATEPIVRSSTTEGPDGWAAMLATVLLAGFFFVRRTF